MGPAIARVMMPKAAKAGDVIEIKSLFRHPMETGYRVDAVGEAIPRHVVTHFTVDYDGERVFVVDLSQGVASNPYIAFYTVATRSGELLFSWTDDRGETVQLSKSLTVLR